jgi:hypothetical protein
MKSAPASTIFPKKLPVGQLPVGASDVAFRKPAVPIENPPISLRKATSSLE